MNAYIYIFALICEAVALDVHMDHSDVGTVLFPQSTLSRRYWTNAQIAVLQARKHFLELIPPIHVLNTRSEDFAGDMLTYFQNSLVEVKKESRDVETERILTLALSDAIGGYLKMWLLPITKFAYYGGTESKDNAINLYKFQDGLMKYLKTDGRGWRNPTSDFLYSMSVNIAPMCTEFPRNIQYPCDDIAYFEKTKIGYTVPMPSISWEKDFECMFFPIKYQGPVSLNSLNSTSYLMKYVNIARYCIITSNLESIEDFDDRFQKWLDINIIPHLNDEKLYPALKSVLSLVNRSKEFDISKSLFKPIRNKFCIGGIPVDLSSKKMMVITIMIILEIAWCIPTLCYLMFTRIRNKKKNIKFYYQYKKKLDNGKGRVWQCSACTITNPAQMTSKQISASPSTQSCACLSKQRRNLDVDVETCFPQVSLNTTGTATRSNFKCQLQPKEIIKKDQAVNRKSSKHAAPISKSVSIKVSKHSLSDKTPAEGSTRPHLTPVYDDVHTKTTTNSFTRYHIKKTSTSFISPCSYNKLLSPATKGSICNCIRPSASFVQCSSDKLDGSLLDTKDLAPLIKKDSSSLGNIDSSSLGNIDSLSFFKNPCKCNCKIKSSSFIKTSCSDSHCKCFKCIPEEEVSSTGSLITVQNLQPTETKTLLQDSVSSVNNGKVSSYIQFAGSEKKRDENANKGNKEIRKTATVPKLTSSQEFSRSNKVQDTKSYIVDGCNKIDKPSHKIDNSNKTDNFNKPNDTKLGKVRKKSVKIAGMSSMQKMSQPLQEPKKPPNKKMQSIAIEKASKETMIYAVCNTKKEPSVSNRDVPLLEITIDRTLPPSTSTSESQAKSSKPSKIPKRYFTTTITQTKQPKTNQSNRKSLIPQWKRQSTVDDLLIQNKKPFGPFDTVKLNVTL